MFYYRLLGPYKRKTNREVRFTQQTLEKNKQGIKNGVSKRRLAKEYEVSESGLKTRLKTGTVPASLGRYIPVFSQQMESDLVKKIQNKDKLFYGLSKIEHQFNKTTQLAVKKWMRMFCQKYNLSIRLSEEVSVARPVGFNKIQV